MYQSDAVLVVEDDEDDVELIKDALEDLKYTNEIIWLKNGTDALNYLRNSNASPFLILSDVNMPGMNGEELRKEILESDDLKMKSIPFIFLTTSINDATINKAFELEVQGYYEKPPSYQQLKEILQIIFSYWQSSERPV